MTNIMQTEICGIKFNEMPNSLWTDDYKINIMETKEKQQTFYFGTVQIAPLACLFSKFNCASLSISPMEDTGQEKFDFDLVKNEETIIKFSINSVPFAVQVAFTPNVTYFPNMNSLSIEGKCPNDFPHLTGNRNLTKLEINYDKHFIPKWNTLEQIKDLTVFNYDELDLSNLTGMTNLERLELISGKMESLHGLESFKHLKTFIIEVAPKLKNLDALVESSSLENIKFIKGKQFRDWSFLAKNKNMRRLLLGSAESADFITELPLLEFFFCKTVRDRGRKKIFYEFVPGYEKMPFRGIEIPHERIHNIFIAPLE